MRLKTVNAVVVGHMQQLYRILYFTALVSACGSPPATLDGHGPQHSMVIDGNTEPFLEHFPLSPLQKNAVVAQIVHIQSNDYQGCSATIVGDRLVVTAAHCVVMNQSEWFDGLEADTVRPNMLFYVAGDSIDAPLCRLAASSVHLHPNIVFNYSTGRIDNDMALIVLEDSVTENCEHLIPIAMNYEPLSEEQIDNNFFLQGGFGSLQNDNVFSPTRYWSLVIFDTLFEKHIRVKDVGEGFPSRGDSGSGLLMWFEDGSVRSVGINSTKSPNSSSKQNFARLDTTTEFIQSIADNEIMCGNFSELGTCQAQAVITCDEHGFTIVRDCGEEGLQCAEDAQGATCICACDTSEYCQADCACQPTCACACDTDEQCSPDCECDRDCVVEGGCNATGNRQLALFTLFLLCAPWLKRRTRSI